MAEPFIGEIRVFSFDFPPHGWAPCDGRELSIAQNQALFAILGTTYGGNGQTTFRLPDLRGRAPVHVGDTVRLGQASGEETHTLSVAELAAHTHGAARTRLNRGMAKVRPGSHAFEVVKRAAIMVEGGRVSAADLGLPAAPGAEPDAEPLDLRTVRERAERSAVIAAMARANDNVAKAADLLGVSRPTLYDLLHRLAIKT